MHSNAAMYDTDVRGTLFYAGDIRGRGRFDVPQPERNNIAFEPREVLIKDVRPVRDTMTLEGAGFVFAKHDSTTATVPELFAENMKHNPVPSGISRRYQLEVAEYLKESTGARDVFPQMGGLLARTSARAKIVKSWATPANFVHLDFTQKSAMQFLEWSMEAEQRTLDPFERLHIYQTWRAISDGPQDNVLAICDGSSVSPEDGVVIDSAIGPEDVPGAFFESRLCKPRLSHEWYYLSDMQPDDLLVFKGFDSEIPDAMNAMHTAFDNPRAGDDAEPRRSIEARYFAVFD